MISLSVLFTLKCMSHKGLCHVPLQVNAADASGQTALHWAGVRGSLSAAETLLRAGAELQAKDSRGYTVSN